MPYVLVHGSGFAASCWDEVVPLLGSDTFAVDLPGRGGRPHDLAELTIAVFADAVAEEIVEHDLHDVVLVGHSLAGITLPSVVERVPDRIGHVVFVAASVPPHGQRVVDTLEDDLRALAEQTASAPPGVMDPALATAMFCDGMSPEQTERTLSIMVAEGPRLILEPVPTTGMDHDVSRSWILLTRDIVNSPTRQRAAIERLGADVYPLEAGHMVMITHPAELARLLREIAGTTPR